MHEAVKKATGIEIANCETCTFLGCGGDGYEYNGTWPICENPKRKGVDNLLSFPFKAEQECWVPEFWQSEFSMRIKHGEDKEILQLCQEFREAVAHASLCNAAPHAG